MKKIVALFLVFTLIGSALTTNGQQCCAWGEGGDPPFLRIVRVCCFWSDPGQGCCDQTNSGAAYCNSYYYVNGEYMSSDFYYTEVSTVKALVCGWGV